MCSKLCFFIVFSTLVNMQVKNPISYAADEEKDKFSCVATTEFPERLRTARCKPRPTVVAIDTQTTSVPPTGMLHPSHIETMLCSGACNHQICLPTNVTFIQMPVTMVSIKGNEITKECASTVVEFHESCSCQCATSEKNCNLELHRFNENKCKCECKDSSHMMKYCRMRRKIWDESACRCKCHKTPKCSTGSLFHSEHCKCIKVEENTQRKSKRQ